MSWRDDLNAEDKAQLDKALNLYLAIRESWTAPESDDLAILTIGMLFVAVTLRSELRDIYDQLL